MLQLPHGALDAAAQTHVDGLQQQVNALPRYQDQVAEAKRLWDMKANSVAGRTAFIAVRTALKHMCFGAIRCGYCGDSMADEIEHILPKSFFPDQAFVWDNYLYACGPCNGNEKRDNYAYIDGRGSLKEVVRKKGRPIRRPGRGIHAFINPRTEDPLAFLTLDLMVKLPTGDYDDGTLEVVARDGLASSDRKRAAYTIKTLDLNRDGLPKARLSAFGSYSARLDEYGRKKANGMPQQELDKRRNGLLWMEHPMVFVEMQRQQGLLPPLRTLFDAAPEALAWTFRQRTPLA
jgi:hypothetical protein